MIPNALSGGVTALITRPGSGIISSGQAVAIKLRSDPQRDMILKPFVDLKMAVRPLIGLRPGQTPATEMGWYAVADEQFRRARVYLDQQKAFAAGTITTKPPVDERLEAFAAVLRGDVMIHVHSHYPGELMMVLHLARAYGFADRLVFAHAQEAFPIAAQLAQTKTISVVGPMFIVRFYGDTQSHNVIKELMDAGAVASIQSDQSEEQGKCFREYGSMLIRHGLTEDQAIQALTINGAKAMMMSDRLGSIDVGKDADLVLMDGSPFDLDAERVEKVLVDGRLEYERTEKRQTAVPTPVGPFTAAHGLIKSEDRAFAITNAQLFTISHGVIAHGTLVVRDGKIAAVQGAGAVPKDIPVLDAGGRVVLPGWVTAKASPNEWMGDLKGQVENNENIEPIVPEMNARFSVDPWFPSFSVLREIGITTQNVTPAQLNLVGGSGVLIKTAGMDIDQMVRKDPTCLVLSMARQSITYWSKGSQMIATTETAVQMIRAALTEAQKYRAQGPARPYNQRLEAFLPALDGKVPVIIQALTVEEIREAMRLAADYHLRLIISSGVEAYKLAPELAAMHAGVILGNTGSEIGEYETIRGGGRGYSDQSPAVLARAGVPVSFFGASGSRRVMPIGRLGGEPALNAAWAFRNGASEEQALRMVTLTPAEMFDAADRVGSLDVGKDADFMLLEGHPFDYRAVPQMVFIDGRLVFRREAARPTIKSTTSTAP
jgi:imidazolonepropionase-like amidohydrolase